MQRTGLLLLISSVAAAACQDPAAPIAGTAQTEWAANVVGAGPCYTVEFDVDLTLMTFAPPFIWQGVVSGDLEGTAVMTLTTLLFATPYSNVAEGTVDWDITGGVVSELTGESFQTRLTLVAVSTPDANVSGLVRLQETELSGVRMANLLGVGENNDPDFPPMVFMTYRGVICP
jgi:hypothetical protein